MNFKNYKTKDWFLLWLMFAIPTAVTGWGIVVWTIFIVYSANSNKQKKKLQQIPLRQRQSVIAMNNNLSSDEQLFIAQYPGYLKIGICPTDHGRMECIDFTEQKRGYVAGKDFVFKYCRCRDCGKVIKYCHWYDGFASVEPAISQNSEYKDYFCPSCLEKVRVSDIDNKIAIEELELEETLHQAFNKFQTNDIDEVLGKIKYYQDYCDINCVSSRNEKGKPTSYSYFKLYKKLEKDNLKNADKFIGFQNIPLEKMALYEGNIREYYRAGKGTYRIYYLKRYYNPYYKQYCERKVGESIAEGIWIHNVWACKGYFILRKEKVIEQAWADEMGEFLNKIKPETIDPVGKILREKYTKESKFKKSDYNFLKRIVTQSDAEIRQERLEKGLI